MEIINEKDLGRFILIDMFDLIFWDSDDVTECFGMRDAFGKEIFRGVYDRVQEKYLD